MKPDDKLLWKKLDRNTEAWRKRRKDTKDYQTVDAVIDAQTIQEIEKLQNKGILGELTGTIASGKESGVFLANVGLLGDRICQENQIDPPIVIKIFRTSTMNFKKMSQYIIGDHRFYKQSKKTRKIIHLWTEKEFRNLQRASFAGLNVPKPILVKKNLLLMELLGENGIPYPLLKNTPSAYTQAILTKILDQVKHLFKIGLVHADLSPFNILIGRDTPFLIDMSQSVITSHPNALKFLERDINNILTPFSQSGVNTPDYDELYDEIIKLTPQESF
ncbi:MAG: serine protein kinase RIO [Candidatus Heimdallarchaeota archaeon]|nr:serine protein kinase RIO [Candidatus Heimdallarchaeota archaeon]